MKSAPIFTNRKKAGLGVYFHDCLSTDIESITLYAGIHEQYLGFYRSLSNGKHTIGLFQGMFDKNVLTFNAGWDDDAQQVESFRDVRDLQRALKSQGVVLG